jgi:hypothetical protein
MPARTTLNAINPAEVGEMLDFAPALLGLLDQVQLLEDRQDSYAGQPARLLSVRIPPPLPEAQKKYLKSVDLEARLWLDSGNVPLAFRFNVAFRGSRFLISFDGVLKDERTFRRINGRLVVTRHVHEESFSGFGQRVETRRLATVAVAD